jgi:glutamate---cysteine ligase / carboxylate-amine ligase
LAVSKKIVISTDMGKNLQQFTIGVEEEYMVLDPTSKELKSHQQTIVNEGQLLFKEKIKAEMHQAVVEVGTAICQNADEAYQEIKSLRTGVSSLAKQLGYSIGASGTHPFSLWETQLVSDQSRYQELLNELQQAARSNLIFGLHVHVGVEDRRMAIHIANTARYFLPHVYALSTNSPFWETRNTGYKSYRSKVFDKFPRTGIPDYFDSIEAYESFVQLLIKTNCIDNAKKIWWDLRVHPIYNTIEFRICDIPMTIQETITITAIFQAICAKIYTLRRQNINFINYQRALINENKWRASRYGIEGKLIDFGKEKEIPTKELIMELLEFVDDVVDDLGSRHHIEKVDQIFATGTGADRQLKIFKETGSLVEVVKYIEQSFLAE